MNESTKTQEWLEMYSRRNYYASEIALLVDTMPENQAREVQVLINQEITNKACLEDYFAAMHNIESMKRLGMLFRKFFENSCCGKCAISGMLAAFIHYALDKKIPNATLH